MHLPTTLIFTIMKPTRFNPDEVAGKTPFNPNEINRNDQTLLDILSNIQKGTLPSPIDKYVDKASGFGDDSNGAKVASMLQEIQNGQTDASQLLASLLNGGNSEFSPERWDLFYQYLLQIASTKDQRAFDLAQLQDSRLYNSPTNELARLMGAGISRDAAIQLLSGSGGSGSGGSAGVAGSGSGVSAPSVPATSGTQELQRQQVITGTVFDSLSALTNMMQSGLSLAQGIQQVQLLRNQNLMSGFQIDAFNNVQQLSQQLQTLQMTGQIEPAEIESLSNANDLIKFLQSKAKDNDAIAQLVNSKSYAGALGSVYGRDYFNKYWDSLRQTRDSGTMLDNYIRGVQLDNAVKALQPNLIAAEMEQIGQQNKESEQRIIESANRIAVGNAQIEVLDAQGNWIKVQQSKSQAELGLIIEQTEGQRIQNQELSLNYEYNKAGFPMLVQNRIDELSTEAARWNTLLRDPSCGDAGLKHLQKAWLSDAANAADAAYVMSLYYNAVGDFATAHPGLYQLGAAFDKSGIGSLIKIGGTVGAAGFRLMPK